MNETLSLWQRIRQTVFWEYAESLAWAVAIALFVTVFIVQAFKIPSGSMLQTLQIGDHLFVSKFIYGVKNPFTDTYLFRGKDPERRDIIVFRYPKDPSVDYIKRIIGVPGDVISMQNKKLYVNDVVQEEPYVQHSQPHVMLPIRDAFAPITVPPDHYFVMGDNRDDSLDSRFWGFVNREAIRGKAWRLYWSSNGFNDIRWHRIGQALH